MSSVFIHDILTCKKKREKTKEKRKEQERARGDYKREERALNAHIIHFCNIPILII